MIRPTERKGQQVTYSKNNLKTPLREKIKLGFALVLIVLFIVQMVQGVQLLQASTEQMNEYKGEALESLPMGNRIVGETDDVVFNYTGDDVLNGVPVHYYLIRTPNGKLLTLRAESGSAIDYQLSKALHHPGTKVPFRGYVREMKDTTHRMLALQYVAANAKTLTRADGTLADSLIWQVVDVAVPDAHVKQEHIIVTFLAAALLLLFIFLLLKKTVANAYETIAVAKGWKESPHRVQKNDLTFELQGMYDENGENGEYFYVNTDFDQRTEHEQVDEWKPVAQRRAEMAAAAQEAIEAEAPRTEDASALTVKEVKRRQREQARVQRKKQRAMRGEQIRRAFFSPLLGEDIYPGDQPKDGLSAAVPPNDTDYFYSQGAGEDGMFYVDLSEEGKNTPPTLSDKSKRY